MILEIVCIYKSDDKQLFVDIKKNNVLFSHLPVKEVIDFIINTTDIECVNFSVVDNSYFRGKNCKLRMEVLNYEQVRLDEEKFYDGDRKGHRRVERGTTRKEGDCRSKCSRRRASNFRANSTNSRRSETNKINRTSDDVLTSTLKYDSSGVVVLDFCSPREFKKNFDSIKSSIPFSPCVDSHSEEELSRMCCLYTRGVGFVAIEKDGNICSVLKDKHSVVDSFSKTSMINALRHGGVKLDCFAIGYKGSLVDMYMNAGFIPVCRVKFNSEYAPEGWKSEWGTPDVVMMMHNLDTADEVCKKYGSYGSYKDYLEKNGDSLVPYFDDYDEALKYRDDKLDELKSKKYSKSLKGGFNRFKSAFSIAK